MTRHKCIGGIGQIVNRQKCDRTPSAINRSAFSKHHRQSDIGKQNIANRKKRSDVNKTTKTDDGTSRRERNRTEQNPAERNEDQVGEKSQIETSFRNKKIDSAKQKYENIVQFASVYRPEYLSE